MAWMLEVKEEEEKLGKSKFMRVLSRAARALEPRCQRSNKRSFCVGSSTFFYGPKNLLVDVNELFQTWKRSKFSEEGHMYILI